jgi:hypothetical protein
MINTLYIFQSKRFTHAMTCVTGRLHLTRKKRDQTDNSYFYQFLIDKKLFISWPSFLSSIQIKQSQHLLENDPLN